MNVNQKLEKLKLNSRLEKAQYFKNPQEYEKKLEEEYKEEPEVTITVVSKEELELERIADLEQENEEYKHTIEELRKEIDVLKKVIQPEEPIETIEK